MGLDVNTIFNQPAIHFAGGAGLVSTTSDYATFCKMLLYGGELDGVRILNEETAKMIMSDQMPEGVQYREGRSYGLAGEVNLTSGEYRWAGAASTAFWIDPSNDMIVIAMAQLMPSNYTYAYEYRDLIERAIIEK
jgi:CubicO group peptidase (beta-lactamase class C family)